MLQRNYTWMLVLLVSTIQAKPQVKPSNILGGLEQHASFSFVRPGLTQTAFAFNGPSSHQSFSSSIGDPHLAHRVLPNVAHALSYRNPGLGYGQIASAPVVSAYTAGTLAPAPVLYQNQHLSPSDYQQQIYQQQQQQQQQALALAYQQQLQQYQQYQQQPQAYSASQAQPAIESEPIQQQQVQEQQQTSNLLGVAYSSAPSVAHVKVNGNGYKFDF